MSNVNVLSLDSGQVDLLLSNHELFSPEEIRIAAKLKVKYQKEADYKIRVMQKHIKDTYEHYKREREFALKVYAA